MSAKKKPSKPFYNHNSVFERRKRAARQRESIRLYWPEWEGPKVEDSVHGRCQVDSGTVLHLDTGEKYCHYCAPVKITEVRPDGSVIGYIDYIRDPDDPDQTQGTNMCANNYNGIRLHIEPDNIWPPVHDLWEIHYAEELAEAKAAGTRCECGGEIASKYGGLFRCKPCIDALKAANLEAIKPKRKKKKP